MTGRKWGLFLVAVVLGLLAGFFGRAVFTRNTDSGPPRVAGQLRERFGESAVGVLQEADRVEVFRVDPKGSAEPGQAGDGPKFGGYRVTATGPERDAAFARRAGGVLLDADNY